MRILFILCIALTSLLPTVHADFFDSEVANIDLELDQLDQIHINTYTFRDTRENIRYENAVRFIREVKDAAKTRYTAGAISYYRMNDIIRDMDALAYALDRHFLFYKRYEQQPKRIEYRTESEEYFALSRASYQKLSATLKRSNQ